MALKMSLAMTSAVLSSFSICLTILLLCLCASKFEIRAESDSSPKVTIIGIFNNGSTIVRSELGVGNGSAGVPIAFAVEFPDTIPILILQCQAPFPVEWTFIDRFPATTDNLRGWHMNMSRYIAASSAGASAGNLWDTDRFIFEANLTFVYRAPAEPRQQVCRYGGGGDVGGAELKQHQQMRQYPATRVNAMIYGRFLGLSVTNLPATLEVHDIKPTRYGNDENCTYALEVHASGKICCERESDNFKFFSRGCSTRSNCRGLFNPASIKCLRNVSAPSAPAPTPAALSSRECISTAELAGYGNSGFIVCGDANNDSNSVAVHYYTSVADSCSGVRRQPTTLYLLRDEHPPVEDDLLAICPLANSKLYVGQVVEFTCFGSYYYFASGFQFVLRSKKAGALVESLLEGYEKVLFTKYAPEKDIIMSTRQQTSAPTRLNGTHVFEVVCAAPVWNSYDWVNKTLRLNVTEPTHIEFSPPGPVEEITLTMDTNITCRARGDPPPRLTWANFTDGTFLRQISNDGVGNVTLEVNFDAWPSSQDFSTVTLVCQAGQDQIGAMALKTFALRRKSVPEFPTVYVLAAMAILLTLVLGVAGVVVWKIVGWTKDRWRSLNQDEIDEFFDGLATSEAESESRVGEEIEVEANAWNCRYDPRFELTLYEDVNINHEIATGEFGKVYAGTLHSRRNSASAQKRSATVAVKKNRPFSSMIDFKASMYELKLLIFLGRHENIVELVGAVTTKLRKRQIFVVFEYCEHGALKNYMRDNREQIIEKSGPRPTLPAPSGGSRSQIREEPQYYSTDELRLAGVIEMGLLTWVVQILNGMLFLRRKKVVHGDLAARNILLDSSLNARICDFGMSHQVTRSYYAYHASPHIRRPCRWSAPESLGESCEFSFQSDMYSFGVLLWEIFSLGEEPWAHVRPDRMLNVLASGEILPMPVVSNINGDGIHGSHETCLVPTSIYDKVKECWRLDPSLRPTVDELHEYFSDCLQQRGRNSESGSCRSGQSPKEVCIA